MYSVVAMATAMTSLSSCSKSDILPEVNEQSYKVSISPIVEYHGSSRAFAPKSSWATDDAIGVFFNNGSFFTNFTGASVNSKYTYTAGTGWSGSTLNVTTVMPSVYAYYPHSGTGNTNPTAITVNRDYDFMVGKSAAPVISNGKADYRIPMTHVLTQFQFTMKKDAGYTAAGNVTSLKIKADANILYNEGTVNLGTKVFTGTTTVREWTYAPNMPLGAATVFKAHGCPVASNNTMSLELVIDGRKYTYKFPNGTTWAAGKMNKYNFTLTATGISIGGGDNGNGTGITIEDWVDTADGVIQLTPIA